MSRWTQTLEERFWAKVKKTETCWNWTGSLKETGCRNKGCLPTPTRVLEITRKEQ